MNKAKSMPREKNQVVATGAAATVLSYQSGWISFLRRISIWVLAVALVYFLELLWTFSVRSDQIDFSHYYVSALAMRQGIDPYVTDLRPLAASLGLEVAEMTIGTYPPTFILCFEPLTLLSPLHAYWLWTALNVVFFALALYLLLDGFPEDIELRLGLVGLAILYTPVTDNFYYAQTQILILLLLVLFMRWSKMRRYELAGVCLAVAGLLKIFPLILVGYLVLSRRVKTIVYTGIGLALGGLATFALVGIRRSLDFLTVLPFLTSSFFLSRAGNLGIAAIISHLFWIGPGDPSLELARRAAIVIAGLTLLVLTATATLKTREHPDNATDQVVALWIVTALLLTPTVWVHYLVLLLIPFAVLVRRSLEGAASRAAWFGIRSYAIAEMLLLIYLRYGHLANWSRHQPYWTKPPIMIGWPLSLLLAYAAAYFLAVDTTRSVAAAGGESRRRSRSGWG